jgi:hypothetical protein
MAYLNYTEVTRLVREAFAEYKRVDCEGDPSTFNDFVNEITEGDHFRLMEKRTQRQPPTELRNHILQAINLHRALGASISSMIALMPTPETSDG